MRRLLALSLLVSAVYAAPSSAQPVSPTGAWINTPSASEAGDAPWAHKSYDGPDANAGYILDSYGLLAGTQFLYDHVEYAATGRMVTPEFTFKQWAGTTFFAWTSHGTGTVDVMPDGGLHFTNPWGVHYYSNGYGHEHFALTRIQIPYALLYILMIEDDDAWYSDGDHQDLMQWFYHPYPVSEDR